MGFTPCYTLLPLQGYVACSQTPVWEHHCRETGFLIHDTPKPILHDVQYKVWERVVDRYFSKS